MRILIIVFLMLFVSCASSKSIISAEEITNFKQIINNQHLEVVALQANPIGLLGVQGIQNLLPPDSSPGTINLYSTINFIRIVSDSLQIDLPYFGEQQMAAGYNTLDNGVLFSGKPTTSEKSFDNSKNTFELKYNVHAKNENYKISITFFVNNSANIHITSSHRTPISYLGKWKVIDTITP